MTDHTPYILGILIVLCAGGFIALTVRAATADEDKWTACANQCAPMAPAEYERACYCDTHTTLPTKKD